MSGPLDLLKQFTEHLTQREINSARDVGECCIGSRSFFHIGEMIQIVSGSKYAILEPDNKISKCRKQLVFIDNTFSENDPSFDDAFPDECTQLDFSPHELYPIKTLKPNQTKTKRK